MICLFASAAEFLEYARRGWRRVMSFPKRASIALLGAALVAVPAIVMAAPVHAATFLSTMEDVPLAPGLAEAPEPVVFESSWGRVIRTTAFGSADYATTQQFYIATLPALGWTREGDSLAFTRASERLSIALEPAAGADSPLNVIFELVVKLAPSQLPE
jgi:hypothetical protein